MSAPAARDDRCAPAAPALSAATAVTTCPRSRFHEAATWCASRVAVGLHAVSGRRLGNEAGILMYHRVVDPPSGVETPTVNVTPGRLRQQLAGLLSRGFQAWSLPQLIEAHHESRTIPPRVFVVTFDDGYENNLLYALPVLEELRVPATIFLATAYLDSDQPYPFDNWSFAGSQRVPAESWRPMTTRQCQELLASELIDFGAHTHTHDAFAGREDAFRRDMATCLDVLRDRFGIEQPTFSFPFGLTTPEMIDIARRAGVTCALTTRPEGFDAATDPFHWGRFTASDLDSAATLAAKLDGWYTPLADVLRAVKRPVAALAPRVTGELMTMSAPCHAAEQEGAGR